MEIDNSFQNLASNLLHDSISDFLTYNSDNLSKKFKVLQINMKSIRDLNRFDVLKGMIDDFRDLDVIVVGESWLNKDLFDFYNIVGYKAFFCGRDSGSKGGGICVYVKDELNVDLISCYDDSFNSIWVKICLSRSEDLYLAAYYRPDWTDFNLYLDHLESFLTDYVSSNSIVCGDMNINALGTDKCREYKSLIDSYGFNLSNTFYTRPVSRTLIDHFVTNFSHRNAIVNHTINNDFSNHSIVMSEMDFVCNVDDYRVNSYVDYERFNEKIEFFLTERNFGELDVDKRCEFIIQAFSTAEADATTERVKRNRKKDLLCHWYNAELNKLRNYKISLIKRIKKMNRRDIDCGHLKFKLKAISNVIISKSKNLKLNYYQNLFQSCSKDSRETWRNINKVLGSKRTSKNVSKIVVNDGSDEISDSDRISEEFNVYYSNVVPDLLENIKTNRDDDINFFNSLSTEESSMFLDPASESEVEKIILGLDNDKSPGADDITVFALKKCSAVISAYITDLANKVLESQIYPSVLKIAKLIPIFKNGDVKLTCNYRPISLLILEKLIHVRITKQDF